MCGCVLQKGHSGDGSDLASTSNMSMIRDRVIYLF